MFSEILPRILSSATRNMKYEREITIRCII